MFITSLSLPYKVRLRRASTASNNQTELLVTAPLSIPPCSKLSLGSSLAHKPRLCPGITFSFCAGSCTSSGLALQSYVLWSCVSTPAPLSIPPCSKLSLVSSLAHKPRLCPGIAFSFCAGSCTSSGLALQSYVQWSCVYTRHHSTRYTTGVLVEATLTCSCLLVCRSLLVSAFPIRLG